MPCQEHLSQLRQHETNWERLNVAIAVVTFEPDHIARTYIRTQQISWPVLIDAERSLYRAYSMDRAPRRAVWSASSLRAYARALRKGRRLQRATGGDIRQRGGDVLIDPQQRVRLHHVGYGPSDRPSVHRLVSAIAP